MTDIIVDEIFPHTPEALWKALTSGDMIARWLMPIKGFEAVQGNRFTFETKPAGAWDGLIQCEVLEVVPAARLVYAWKSGDAGNVGYGALLDSVVTWTLTKTDKGTRLKLVHSGFVMPKNESAHKTMGEGWKKVLPRIGAMISEGDS